MLNVFLRSVCCVLLLNFCVCLPGEARPQAQQAELVGPMQAGGQVFLNGMPVSGQQTLYAGDDVRTGADGVAAVTLPGVGALGILAQSEVTFAGQYLSTLKVGSITIRSLQAGKNFEVQFRNIVVFLPFSNTVAAGTITAGADGVAKVECRDGTVGVNGVRNSEGIELQPGQLITIGSDGSLQNTQTVAQPATPSLPGGAPPRLGRSWHPGYLILGVAAGGGGIVAAIITSRKSTPVSPSQP